MTSRFQRAMLLIDIRIPKRYRRSIEALQATINTLNQPHSKKIPGPGFSCHDRDRAVGLNHPARHPSGIGSPEPAWLKLFWISDCKKSTLQSNVKVITQIRIQRRQVVSDAKPQLRRSYNPSLFSESVLKLLISFFDWRRMMEGWYGRSPFEGRADFSEPASFSFCDILLPE